VGDQKQYQKKQYQLKQEQQLKDQIQKQERSIYQHRPQITKTNFCVIHEENNSLLFSLVSG